MSEQQELCVPPLLCRRLRENEAPPARPSLRTDIDDVVIKYHEALKRMLPDDITGDEGEREDLKRMLLQAGDDAYEQGKFLESCHWDVDMELIRALGDIDHVPRFELERLTKEWVRGWAISLPRSVGERVAVRRGMKAETCGQICKLYPDIAKYGVRVELQDENSHYLFAAEDIERWNVK